MGQNIKKLKLNIKGSIRNYLTKWFLRRKINNMGLKIHDLKDLSNTQVELVVSGEKDKLWDVVKLSKTQDVFIFLNEVIFEFADAPTPL